MTHLLKRRQRRRAHALRRRIGRNQVGMLFFQRTQFAHQAIVLRVGNFRRVHDVIQIFMMTKRGSQLGDFVLYGFHNAPSEKENPRQAGVQGTQYKPGCQALASITSRIRAL